MSKRIEYDRDVKPCPLCGAGVRLVVMGKEFEPGTIPGDDSIYPRFNVRAHAKCHECLVSLDLAQSGYFDPKLTTLRELADTIADEVESRWNRRYGE